MLRRVHLHGPLEHLAKGPIQIHGKTVAEVIEGISRQIPGLQPTPKMGRQRLAVVGCPTAEDLYKDLGDQEDIHIVPQIMGGKDGALTQILLGAVLIGVSLIPGVGTAIAGFLLQAGALTALGGIAMMLAPTPEDDRSEQVRSRYLGSPRNTTKIGTRIPVLYGRYRWGGHILSFDINAIEFRGNGTTTTSGGK